MNLGSIAAIGHANPDISEAYLDEQDRSKLIIQGSNFSEKSNPTPLLWWHADEGEAPNPISRTTWNGNFQGTHNTAITSLGSNSSYSFDHGTVTGAALGRVDFNSDTLFMYRKLYEDFDVTKKQAIRTRVNHIDGTLTAGDVVTGLTSGATGKILQFDESYSENSASTTWINYTDTEGSINSSPPIDFIYGETMKTNTGASFINAEGSEAYPTGTFRTFNYKTVRMWGEKNNSYPVAQGRDGSHFNFNHEYTDKTFWSSYMTHKLYQTPEAWQTQELAYQSSSLNQDNGHFEFTINGVREVETNFISITDEHPTPYYRIYQSQVSNGAQPGSNVYYDSLYIDDTWHRVILCDQATYEDCTKWEIQIPREWANGKITLEYRRGSLADAENVYAYIFDNEGNHNAEGFKLVTIATAKPPQNFGASSAP